MTIPSALFALVFALFIGSLYHLIRGGGFWRLIFYLTLSAIGFVVGHLVGLWRGWVFIQFGSLNVGMSSVGCLLLLALGDWLSRIQVSTESTV